MSGLRELEHMIRYRYPARVACWALALVLYPAAVIRAEDPPVTLSVLGAVDGQMKLLAETAMVSTDVTVESIATTATTGTFRVSPLRDSAGHLFAVALTLPASAAAATTS